MKTHVIVISMLGVLLFAGGLARATIENFYSDRNIANGDSFDEIHIFDTPPDQTTVTMWGGSAKYIRAYNSSIFLLEGGNVTQCIAAYNTSSVTIAGGTANSVEFYNSSIANLSGGNITGSLGVFETASAHIYGKNFNLTPVGGGSSGWIIEGIWADNTPFSIYYRINAPVPPPGDPNSKVYLHTIPEPASLFLLLFGIIGIKKFSR